MLLLLLTVRDVRRGWVALCMVRRGRCSARLEVHTLRVALDQRSGPAPHGALCARPSTVCVRRGHVGEAWVCEREPGTGEEQGWE